MAYNSTHTGAEIDAGITKAQGVETGATANATDAQLRDRSTHTGTQDAATITGLADVATSGGYGDLTGVPATFTPEAHTHTLSDIFDAGTAAGSDNGDFATAYQGSLAGSALQPGANVSTLANDAQYLPSDPAGVTGADQITNIISLTRAEYDAIGKPDGSTFYVITG